MPVLFAESSLSENKIHGSSLFFHSAKQNKNKNPTIVWEIGSTKEVFKKSCLPLLAQ